MQPFGGPVVPEVYWSVKRSSSSIGGDRVGERRRVLGLEACALGLELRQVVHRQQVAESRQRAALLLDRSRLFRVSAQHPDGLRVVEDVGRVVGRAVRVDGRDDRADLSEREVEQRPLHVVRAKIANDSPFRTPRARRPLARFSTRSAASAQPTSCQWSPCWTR